MTPTVDRLTDFDRYLLVFAHAKKIKWNAERRPIAYCPTCANAASTGDIDTLDYGIERARCGDNMYTMESAAGNPDESVIRYVWSLHCPFDGAVFYKAFSNANRRVLDFVLDNCRIQSAFIVNAAASRRLSSLEYVHSRGIPITPDSGAMQAAVCANNLPMLRYAYMNMLKGTLNNLSVPITLLVAAARKCSSDLCRFVIDVIGLPLNKHVLCSAVIENNVPVVEMLCLRRCPCDESAVSVAICHDHYESLLILNASGYPWYKSDSLQSEMLGRALNTVNPLLFLLVLRNLTLSGWTEACSKGVGLKTVRYLWVSLGLYLFVFCDIAQRSISDTFRSLWCMDIGDTYLQIKPESQVDLQAS